MSYSDREPDFQPTPLPVSPAPSNRRVRSVLWLVLVISASCNMVASGAGLPVLVGVGFGLVTLACIVALVVHHYRHRGR